MRVWERGESEIPSPNVLSLFVHFLFARAKRKWTLTRSQKTHRPSSVTASPCHLPPRKGKSGPSGNCGFASPGARRVVNVPAARLQPKRGASYACDLEDEAKPEFPQPRRFAGRFSCLHANGICGKVGSRQAARPIKQYHLISRSATASPFLGEAKNRTSPSLPLEGKVASGVSRKPDDG